MIVRNNKKVDLRQVGLILTILVVVGGVSGGCGGGFAKKTKGDDNTEVAGGGKADLEDATETETPPAKDNNKANDEETDEDAGDADAAGTI